MPLAITQSTGLQPDLPRLAWQFFRGLAVAAGAFLLGNYGCSPAWLVIGVAFWITHDNYLRFNFIRRNVNLAAAKNEKETILEHLRELPSWVFFPDVERAEWVNKLLLQLWPFIGHYVRDMLKASVEPAIKESLPGYLRGFRFEKIDLGDEPPRIGGVKVYHEHTARNEIIMDLEILYTGDCNFQVQVATLKAGIKSVQAHGTLRVMLKPLISEIPLVGAVTVFFLNPPAVDFNMTNIANVLDLPGLKDILRKVIHDQLVAMFVLPNKFHLRLSDHIRISALKCEPPAGILRLGVICGRDLMKADIGMLGMGKSDPYAVIRVGAQVFKTGVKSNTVDPRWNFHCEAIVYHIEGATLDIEIFDQDQSSKDDFLGRATVQMQLLVGRFKSDMWLSLEDTTTGEILINATWLYLCDNIEGLHAQVDHVRKSSIKELYSTSLLLVYVDSAQHLPNASRVAGEPSPQVTLTVGQKQETTAIRSSTNDPVWEECFMFMLHNPELQDLLVEITDTKYRKMLGSVNIRLNRLLKEKSLTLEEPFSLGGSAKSAKLKLFLQLKIFRQEEPTVTHEETYVSGSESGNSRSSPAKSVSSETDSPSHVVTPVSVPSLEAMVHSTVTPVLDTAHVNRNILDNTSKQSSPSRSIKSDSLPGRINCTLRYSPQRNRLVIVVHKVADLPRKANDDQPDTYVKVYLISDGVRGEKQKTQVCKGSSDPVFDETMNFEVNLSDMVSCELELTVASRSGSSVFGRGRTLGRCHIPLSKLDLSKAVTEWYDLEAADD